MGRMIDENLDVTALYVKIYKDEGITQSELAKLLGLSNQSGVARVIQRGATLNTLYKLLKAIGGYRMVIEKVSPKGRVMKRYEIKEEE